MAYADAFDAKYPGLLDAMSLAESSNNPGAVSPKGAIGLFQFMPATAADLGIDPKDPIQARNAAARYMDSLISQTGNIPNALAAWNWGIGHVQRLGVDKAPPETRGFIGKVMGNWNGAQAPAQLQGDDITNQIRQAINQPQQQDSGGIISSAYADTMPHPQDDPVMADMQAAMGDAGKGADGPNEMTTYATRLKGDQQDPGYTRDANGMLTINVDVYRNKEAADPVMQDIQAAMGGKLPPQQPDQSSYLDDLKYGFAGDDFKKSLHPKGGWLGNALQGVGMVPDALGAMAGGLTGSVLGPGGTIAGTALGGMAGHQVDNLIGQALGVQSPLTIGQQAVDFGSNALDNLTGALAGPVIDKGLGAAWTAGKNAISTVKNAVTGGDPTAKAGQILRDANTSGTQNVLDAINNQQGTIAGHNPTLGQVSDDSGLKALERSVFSRGDAKTQGQYADRLQSNKQAVTDAINSVKPQTEAQATKEFVTQQHANTENYFTNREAAQQSALDQKLTQANAGRDQPSASEAARAQLETNLKAARTQERGLWQAIDPGKQVTADTEGITDRAKQILANTNKTESPEDTPLIIKQLTGTEGTPKPQIFGMGENDIAYTTEGGKASLLNKQETVDNIMALRSRIMSDIRDEQGQLVPNRNKIRKLTDLNDAITETLNGVGNSLSDPAAAARWQEANSFSRQLNDTYTRGLTGRVLGTDATGADRVADSATLSKFLHPGNGAKEDAQSLIKAMGGADKAEPYARDYLIKDALGTANPDGTLNIKNLQRWITNHGDVLDQFPNIKNELGDVLKASQTLKNTGELKARTLDDFQNSVAGLYLKNDPSHVISTVLGKSGDPIADAQQLMRQVGMNRDATAGVQRAVFDHMMGQVQSAMTDDVGGAKFMNYLKKNNGALKTMLTPQQYDMLQNVGEAVRMNSRVSNFNPVAGSQTVSNASALPQEKGFKGKVFGMLLDKIKGLGGAAGGVLGGPMGAVGGVAADSAINAIRNMSNEKVMGLLRDAFMDPKLAAKLMQPVNKVTTPGLQKVLRPYVVQSVVQPTFQQSPPHKVWHNMWQPSPSYQ